MNIPLMKIIDYCLGILLCVILGWIHRIIKPFKPKKDLKEIRKILLIKTWGMGNLVILFPTIKTLRDKFPRAKVSLFTLRGNEGVLEENPLIDNYYLLNIQNPWQLFLSCIKNFWSFRKEKFDLVIDFDQFSRITALFAFFSGAKLKVGFNTKGQGRGQLFDIPVAYNDHQHIALTFFNLVKALGVREGDLKPLKIPLSQKDEEEARILLQSNQIEEKDLLIGMHLGSGDNVPQRRWPVENFAKLAKILVSRYGAKIILTGVKAEIPLAEEVLKLVNFTPINLMGKTNPKVLAAIIQRCALFFSNDTSAVHIASAMGTDVVGFYGPNTPTLYGPRGKNDLTFYKNLSCSPCMTNFNNKSSNCKNPQCILDIKVEEVLKKVEKKYFLTGNKR